MAYSRAEGVIKVASRCMPRALMKCSATLFLTYSVAKSR